jgi:hypothetical protein
MPRRRQGSTRERTARFGVYLDDATHAALRKTAIDENISATELVERLIRDYLKRKGRSPKGR